MKVLKCFDILDSFFTFCFINSDEDIFIIEFPLKLVVPEVFIENFFMINLLYNFFRFKKSAGQRIVTFNGKISITMDEMI